MREIKFRGLNANDEFVYGDLRKDLPNSTKYYDKYSQRICWDYSNQPVKNGTVGQYTRLLDKNKTPIYEGDIVEAWSEGIKAKGEVKQRIDGYWLMYPAWQSGVSWCLAPNENGETTVEVIGNIHQSKFKHLIDK